MPNETTAQLFDFDPPEPISIQLGQEYYPFRLPTKIWHKFPFSLVSGRYSAAILQNSVFPELMFFNILYEEMFSGTEDQWRIKIEADESDLYSRGLIKKSLTEARSVWDAPIVYDFEHGVLERVRQFELLMQTPHGDFVARPSEERLLSGEFVFDGYYQEDVLKRFPSVNPNDQEYLDTIVARFDIKTV